jgi:hypothetical protein
MALVVLAWIGIGDVAPAGRNFPQPGTFVRGE